jgi:hypothetical protein
MIYLFLFSLLNDITRCALHPVSGVTVYTDSVEEVVQSMAVLVEARKYG